MLWEKEKAKENEFVSIVGKPVILQGNAGRRKEDKKVEENQVSETRKGTKKATQREAAKADVLTAEVPTMHVIARRKVKGN